MTDTTARGAGPSRWRRRAGACAAPAHVGQPATPPSTGTGVINFLMGDVEGFCLSTLSRDRPRGMHPGLVRVVEPGDPDHSPAACAT